jgi:hypothetical protein
MLAQHYSSAPDAEKNFIHKTRSKAHVTADVRGR